MVAQVFRIIRAFAVIGGVLLSFFTVTEVLRFHQALSAMHPMAGTAFLIVLAAVAAVVLVWFIVVVASRPRVLVPPRLGDLGQASARALRRRIGYLGRYVRRLGQNVCLTPDQQKVAIEGRTRLAAALALRSAPDMLAAVNETEQTIIEPLVAVLDAQAERQVRDTVRSVMLWVAVSPYRSADLLIVLYRNAAMVARIIRIYHSRPRLREQWLIFRDTMRVVATVNYLNMGKNLIEGLGAKVPFAGRFLDEVAQGLGAGFMTATVGHAAVERCRAFRCWNQAAAADSLHRKAGVFFNDVRKIFLDDVLHGMRSRLAGMLPSEEAWDRFTGGVASALDSTARTAGSFIARPAMAGRDGAEKLWRRFFGRKAPAAAPPPPPPCP